MILNISPGRPQYALIRVVAADMRVYQTIQQNMLKHHNFDWETQFEIQNAIGSTHNDADCKYAFCFPYRFKHKTKTLQLLLRMDYAEK